VVKNLFSNPWNFLDRITSRSGKRFQCLEKIIPTPGSGADQDVDREETKTRRKQQAPYDSSVIAPNLCSGGT
jgi:hypothetical protein